MTAALVSAPPRAVVVGGARGVGRATVLRLAASGANVILCYEQNESAARDTAEQASELGPRPVLLQADIATDAGRLVEESVSRLGGLDLVVVTAVPVLLDRVMDVGQADFRRAMDVVVWGFQQVAAAAAAELSRTSGSLVAVSSLGSWRYASYYGTLGPAKAALESLVRYLAAELGPRGVRVNAVSPCLVDDAQHFERAQDVKRFLEPTAERTPLRRLATPAEIAAVALALCSADFSFVTGQTIVVDGGYSLLA